MGNGKGGMVWEGMGYENLDETMQALEPGIVEWLDNMLKESIK